MAGSWTAALGVAAPIAGGATALVLGAVAVVAGFALLGPAVAATLARVVGRPLDLAGAPGRLAQRSAARALRWRRQSARPPRSPHSATGGAAPAGVTNSLR